MTLEEVYDYCAEHAELPEAEVSAGARNARLMICLHQAVDKDAPTVLGAIVSLMCDHMMHSEFCSLLRDSLDMVTWTTSLMPPDGDWSWHWWSTPM